MKLAPVGHVENVEEIDLEPITIPICGIDRTKKKEVVEEFNFRPSLPWGNTFAMIEQVEGGIHAMAGNTVKWLKGCLLNDEERDRFRQFLDSPTVEIEQDTIEALYNALTEAYSGRPTLPRTGSTGTGDSTEPTSKGASSGSGSRSGRKR